MWRYEHVFLLEASVTDFDEAEEYLNEDRMINYLKSDTSLPEVMRNSINSVEWHMNGMQSVRVSVITDREMSNCELESLMEWVNGQNVDGLGEGFEQQPFANYCDDEGDEGDYLMASFVPVKDGEMFDLVGKE